MNTGGQTFVLVTPYELCSMIKEAVRSEISVLRPAREIKDVLDENRLPPISTKNQALCVNGVPSAEAQLITRRDGACCTKKTIWTHGLLPGALLLGRRLMLHADDAVKCYCCRSLGVRHQVCVPFGHFQASVPHKFSNDGLPVTLLGQKARECMAKTVKDELVTTIEHPLVQLHFLHCLGERLTHIKEHGARLAWKDEKSGIVGKPVFKGRLHCLSHEGKATAPIFALPNENGAVFKVQVAYLQFGDLAESQPALHGDEAHEPRLGVLLLNLSQQCFGLRFCKKAGALVVHFGHDKLNKRRGAVPQLPHQGLVHDAPHLAQNVFNGLRGITLTSLLQREFLQVDTAILFNGRLCRGLSCRWFL